MRLCGDFISSSRIAHNYLGSSPRAWGLFGRIWLSPQTCRFIPTCVGFIPTSRIWHYGTFGSSPRAWGLCTSFLLPALPSRFIPTCVGFMMRGLVLGMLRSGSSPRAWGLSKHRHRPDAAHRFIPTCVGFMHLFALRPRNIPVHPHVRGVYGVENLSVNALPGSSPRAWGL